MKTKQTPDYLPYNILTDSEICSTLFELQNGQIVEVGSPLEYIPQLLQCHLQNVLFLFIFQIMLSLYNLLYIKFFIFGCRHKKNQAIIYSIFFSKDWHFK
jgi:uncharacterized protein YuzB (UPF0349 family)